MSVPLAEQAPGGRDNFLLTDDQAALLSTCLSATSCRHLRVGLVKWDNLNEVHVRHGILRGVMGFQVIRDHVTGLKAVVFQKSRCSPEL